MIRFLREIWPALLPLLLYAAWLVRTRRRWEDGPWFWAVLSSIALAVACLLWLGLSEPRVKGDYVPPHMESGHLVPGRVR